MGRRESEFSNHTKKVLANRVGTRCSNPDCRIATMGPISEPDKYMNLGEAAHISAASVGGPRYDENLTVEERKDISNGIWLCKKCARMIDLDVSKYTVEVLQQWKEEAELKAIEEVSINSPVHDVRSDEDLIVFYAQCFDRNAFKVEICREFAMEDFEQAIEDTLIAINTGVLRSRDGQIIKQSEGKMMVQNPGWHEKLDIIASKLSDISNRLKLAKAENAYEKRRGTDYCFYFFFDESLKDWIECTRREIIGLMSSMCKEVGIRVLSFPEYAYT